MAQREKDAVATQQKLKEEREEKVLQNLIPQNLQEIKPTEQTTKLWWEINPLDYLYGLVDSKNVSKGLYDTVQGTQSLFGRYPNMPALDERARIEFERLNLDAELKITPSEYIDRQNFLLDTTRTKWDAEDAENLFRIQDGAKSSLLNLPGLTSFALTQAGILNENKNPALSTNLKGSGGTLGGITDIVEGVTAVSNRNLISEMIKPGFFGRGVTILQIPLGLWQFGASATRLVKDPTLMPTPENQEDIWLKRGGVAAQGIGAAMITAGAVIATALAFSVVLAPVAPLVAGILIGAGVLISGAGAIMENWDWIKETAKHISNP